MRHAVQDPAALRQEADDLLERARRAKTLASRRRFEAWAGELKTQANEQERAAARYKSRKQPHSPKVPLCPPSVHLSLLSATSLAPKRDISAKPVVSDSDLKSIFLRGHKGMVPLANVASIDDDHGYGSPLQ